MARPRKTDRPVEKSISLPLSIVVKVELELFSELEGRVPFGAWGQYIVRLVEADLARRGKLSPFRASNGMSHSDFV